MYVIMPWRTPYSSSLSQFFFFFFLLGVTPPLEEGDHQPYLGGGGGGGGCFIDNEAKFSFQALPLMWIGETIFHLQHAPLTVQ
jgi:hypothetical protein